MSVQIICINTRKIDPEEIKTNPGLAPTLLKYYTAIYDNSFAFRKYLKKQGAEEAAQKAGVKLKSKHTIVPHVCPPNFAGFLLHSDFWLCPADVRSSRYAFQHAPSLS